MENTSQDLISLNENDLAVAQSLIAARPGLSKEIVPSVARFSALGLSGRQLEDLIGIAIDSGINQGSSEKLREFLDAIYHVYGEDYLVPMSRNFTRFNQLLEEAREVERIRSEFTSGDCGISYFDCFDLANRLGVEQIEEVVSSIAGDTKGRRSKVYKNVEALYILKELVEESKKSGHDVRSLFDLRTGDIRFYPQS